MASKGEFPKVDGDIFYGNEASYVGRCIANKAVFKREDFDFVGSSANFQTVGSAVYSANEVTNPFTLTSVFSTPNLSTQGRPKLVLSGVHGTLTIDDGNNADNTHSYVCNGVVGSPESVVRTVHQHSTTFTDDMTASAFNPGSGFVAYFQLLAGAGSETFNTASITIGTTGFMTI